MERTGPGTMYILIHLILTTTKWSRQYYQPHFAGKEAKVLKKKFVQVHIAGKWLGYEPLQSSFRVSTLNHSAITLLFFFN